MICEWAYIPNVSWKKNGDKELKEKDLFIFNHIKTNVSLALASYCMHKNPLR